MSPTIYYLVFFEPLDKRIAVSECSSLLEAASRADIRLDSGCGGSGDCGQCEVIVLDGQLSPLRDEEFVNLSAAQLSKGYRLACYARIQSDVRVYIPKSSIARKSWPHASRTHDACGHDACAEDDELD